MFFITLSKMPPALMLLVIIGLAVLVTSMVTGRMAQQEQELAIQSGNISSATSKDEMKAPVMVSVRNITQGTTITSAMVEQTRLYESNIFEDAVVTTPNAIGRVAKHTIPPLNQIRETDLQ